MASTEWMTSVDIPSGSMAPLELNTYLATKAKSFFEVTDLTTINDYTKWVSFSAAVANLYVSQLEKDYVSKSAVDVMCQTMADNKTTELAAARAKALTDIAASLQSFCDDPNLSDLDKTDVQGILRAVTIIGKSS